MSFLTSPEEKAYLKKVWTKNHQKQHSIAERKEHRQDGTGFGEHYIADALTEVGRMTGYFDEDEYNSYVEHNNQIYHDLDNPVDLLPTSYNYDDSKQHNKEMHSYNGNPDAVDHVLNGVRYYKDAEGKEYYFSANRPVYTNNTKKPESKSNHQVAVGSMEYMQNRSKEIIANKNKNKTDSKEEKEWIKNSYGSHDPKIQESNQTFKRYSQRRPEEADANNKLAHIRNGNNKKKNNKSNVSKQVARSVHKAAKAIKKVANTTKPSNNKKNRPVQNKPKTVINETIINNNAPKGRRIHHASHMEPAKIYATGKDSLIIDKVEYLGELKSNTATFKTDNPGTFSYNPGTIGRYLKKYSQLWTSYRIKTLDLHFIPLSSPGLNNGGALAAQTGSTFACVQCNVNATRPTDNITMMNTYGALQRAPWKGWTVKCPKNNMFGMYTIRNADAQISAKNNADYCNFTVATSGNVNNTTTLGILQLHVVIELIGGKITPSADPVGVSWFVIATAVKPIPDITNKIVPASIKGNMNVSFEYQDSPTYYNAVVTNVAPGNYEIDVGYIGMVGTTHVLMSFGETNIFDSSGGSAATSFHWAGITGGTGFPDYHPDSSAPTNCRLIYRFTFNDPRSDGIMKLHFASFAITGATNALHYVSLTSLPSTNFYALYDPLESKLQELKQEFDSKLSSFKDRLIVIEEEEDEKENEEEELFSKLEEANNDKEALQSEKDLLVSLLSKMQSGTITELDKRVIKNFTK